ncbi:glycoside hydrolase family 9 protein [Listeria ivanovii]|uniref:glycoside hydrolase family 9 protein n=1 Tax=Listeria ivanovii TaxID=1638 RepID=UPI00065E6107|nr:glycoside hydrolase family 9 protein [Listeria ivanovii]
MKPSMERQIAQTGIIHRPLPIETKHALETIAQKKQVLTDKILFSAKQSVSLEFTHQGPGEYTISKQGEIRLTSPIVMPHWPVGAPDDGDYTNFGNVLISAPLENEDWNDFNRVRIQVFPNFPGVTNPYLMISFKNDGTVKVPDIYGREGVHGVNLINHEWNDVIFEVEGLPRDKMTEISFSYYLNGPERLTAGTMELLINEIKLEKIANPEISKGWIPQNNALIYSHNGYSKEMPKIAFCTNNVEAATFTIHEKKADKLVFTGKSYQKATETGNFVILDFSELQTVGEYYLKFANRQTDAFQIGESQVIWESSIWKSLNFIFCERCGCPVFGKHTTCHADIIAEHNGKQLSFNGGWHDAGDVSQQLIQTAEVTMALYEVAGSLSEKDEQLRMRLLEEGEWGLDFLLKTRFGDGYRATSAGMTRWTDGLVGGMDDAIARVHNQAYENFYCAGIEAFIGGQVNDNPAMQNHLRKIAEEDLLFAMAELQKHGTGQKPIFWEHTYQTSESLYYATASWAASMVYQLTKKEEYAEKAAEWLALMLEAQEKTGILDSETNERYNGFFYRDKSHKVIQHFNHQAREHLYLLAIEAAVETQPAHKAYKEWLQAVEMYGDYLKKATRFTKPYPLIPAGLYKKDEYLDEASFHLQHLLIDERAIEEYKLQFEQGIQLNEEISLRKFPIWFSFRGNNAILLSAGKAASVAGKILQDKTLLEIAEGQLQWVIGMNPFGQSMMHGEGYRYAQQYSVLNGEITGEIPVGMETFRNEDEPYWPEFNNATYKEVWVGNAGKWMSIVADLNKITEKS